MPKGIKQIKHTAGQFFSNMSSRKLVVIAANQNNTFEVAEWAQGTNDNDKNSVKWLLEDGNRNEILLQFANRGPQVNILNIPPKMCGANNNYYIEATFSGEIDHTSDTGMYVRGFITPAIVSTQWRDVSNKPLAKDKPIAFGDDVILHAETQGLCKSKLVVKVYHRNWGGDVPIDVFNDVDCIKGEINLLIQDTHAWYDKVWHLSEHEFYITVEAKEVTGLIKDTTPHGDTFHARYLRMNNTLLNVPKTLPPKNLTPAKTGDNDLNIRKYEPCGFTHIEIKDDDDRVVLFDEGKLQQKGQMQNNFAISEQIFYDFDKSEIRGDAKPVMDKLGNYLLESPYVPVELGSHTDSRGTDVYNMALSERRAQAAVKYLIGKGIASDRIVAKGYGKTSPVVPGDNLSEAEHQKNRRTTIKYRIFENDGESLIYETIGPDSTKKRKIDITIKNFKIDGCIRSGKEKHTTDVKVIEQTSIDDSKNPTHTLSLQGELIHTEVYANLAKAKLFPYYYIWPIRVKTDNFLFFINSCRYFSNKGKPSVLIKVYPDIKWTLTFFLNLTNDLSIKWQDAPKEKIHEYQQKAGKIGAERRWKQKDASFGFSLKSEWNKEGEHYGANNEVKTEFETKIKRLYDLFASLGNIADGITNTTKGRIRNIGFKGMPMTFEVKPPNVKLQAIWMLKRAHEKKQAVEKVGTQIAVQLSADPLIGLEMTVDLLALAVGAVAGAVTDGMGSEKAVEIYNTIKSKMKEGISGGDDELGGSLSADIYIDLVLSGTITASANFTFNTVGDGTDTSLKLETAAKLKAEIKAGSYIKATMTVLSVTAQGYFEMTAGGNASVTFGHSLQATNEGLFYRPQLGFDGLNVEYTLVVKASLSTKKMASSSDQHTLYDQHGEQNGLIPKFDVIKSLEEVSGLSADIYIVRYENN